MKRSAMLTERNLTYACSCGEEYTEQIAALGHKEVTDPAVEPTETEDGKTEGSHCSVCKEVLKEQQIIPATGKPDEHEHKYEVTVTKEPTCTEEGIKTYACSCGEEYTEQAGAALDRQMDQSVDDLRDLALAVAEKVVCVSLKSSGDVISRMIQTAIDKRKKKEWVHIYISECDAKRLTQIPASLSAALTALSDRVRLIPMSDDESGTCIIEMPDEIVDASAATQLNNLRTILMDTANSASGMNLFH